MAREVASRDTADFIKDLVAFNHATENRVAPALHVFAAVIEEVIIFYIDKKLGGGGMRIHCSGHRYGAAIVGETIVRLVFDWLGGWFLSHVGVETASLNHEIVDDPMKDGAVVEAVVYVGQKVFYRLWRFFAV